MHARNGRVPGRVATLSALLAVASPLLVVALLAAEQADARRPMTTKLRLVARSSSVMNTDGERYLVWQRARGWLRVFDTRRRRSAVFAYDPSCYPQQGLRQVADRHALLFCRNGTREIISLTTGESLQVPAAAEVEGVVRGASYFYIGRHWLAGNVDCGGISGGCPLFYNWKTGEQRVGDRGEPIRDLDRAQLPVRTPCAPWEHIRLPYYAARRYEAPYLLGGRRRMIQASLIPLVLGRCGGRQRVLDRTGGFADYTSISSRLVSWVGSGGRVARAYDVRTRRRWAWRVPRRFEEGAVAHTRNSVFVGGVLDIAKPGVPTGFRIYEARLRR